MLPGTEIDMKGHGMTITDDTWAADDEEVLDTPPPRQPQPDQTGQPAQPAVQVDGDQPKKPAAQKRPLAARGTVALGGTAVVGTLLAVIGGAYGPVAVIATAAGVILLPLATWNALRQSRTRRRAGARRARNRAGGAGRRNGNAWLPNILGGAGRTPTSGGTTGRRTPAGAGTRRARTAGTGGSAGGARRRATGSTGGGGGARRRATAGLGGGGSRRRASGGWGGWGGSRRRSGGAGRGSSAGGGRRRGRHAGTGRGWGGWGGWGGSRRGRKAGWKGSRGRGGSKRRDRAGGNGSGRRPGDWYFDEDFGAGAWGGKRRREKATGTGKAAGAGKAGGGRNGAGSGKSNRGAGKRKTKMDKAYRYWQWDQDRRRTRRGRAAAWLNGFAYRWGSATARGVREENGRAAYARAYRRYGRFGNTPTATGWFGRVAGGVLAGVPAALARWLINLDRLLSKKFKLSPKETTTEQGKSEQGETTSAPDEKAAAPGAEQPKTDAHPVPPPAFDPAESEPPRPGTPPDPTPIPVATGGGSTTFGGNTMASIFPGYSDAVNFRATCAKWAPLGDDGNGSIWALQDALPGVRDALFEIANGFTAAMANCELHLEGGMKPGMKLAFSNVHRGLVAACDAADELPGTFVKVYAEAIERANMPGGKTMNV